MRITLFFFVTKMPKICLFSIMSWKHLILFSNYEELDDNIRFSMQFWGINRKFSFFSLFKNI